MTAAIQNIVEKLKSRQHRDSTRNNYYKIWQSFNEFFVKLDSKPETWEERLILFVGYLVDKELKSTTIQCYISVVKAILKADGEFLDENIYLLKALTRACKIRNDKVRIWLPIRKSVLKLLVHACDDLYPDVPQPYLVTLYRAILTTMYYGLFRISEVTKTESNHVLKVRDVKIGKNKHKMRFMLRTSKTHGHGSKPQIIKINSSNYNSLGNAIENQSSSDTQDASIIRAVNQDLCPFTILNNYLQVRKCFRMNDNEQFFVFKDGSPVTGTHV